MKKKYSLDYSIERDTDRLKAVEDILDHLDSKPNNTDLEQLASYILYGKDEDGKNAMQRGECDDRETRRYKTFKKLDEKVKSLDEIMEDPLANELNFMDMEKRYVYTKKTRTIKRPTKNSPGDSDIPGMVELWEAIDHIEHVVAANEGKLDFNEDDTIISDKYRLWQLKHQLVDMRRHQYYLLESYKPILHFNAPIRNSTPTYNFDSDSFYWMPRAEWEKKIENNFFPYISSNIEDYETRINENTGEEEVKWVVRHQAFDWENPYHIKQLMLNYSDIYMQVHDKLDSWGRTLIYDFDRYFTLSNFTPVREYIVLRRIDKASPQTIAQEVQEKFGLKYTDTHILVILNKEIPNEMAKTAQRVRLLIETPDDQRKVCSCCKRNLPITPLFYARNATKAKGVESRCKECQKKTRIAKGVQMSYDQRRKDAAMLKM